jgi:hypothetical protein
MVSDYIPVGEAEFDQRFKYINQYVAEKCGSSTPAWTLIPQTARTAMANAYSACYTAYAKNKAPHTPVDMERRRMY